MRHPAPEDDEWPGGAGPPCRAPGNRTPTEGLKNPWPAINRVLHEGSDRGEVGGMIGAPSQTVRPLHDQLHRRFHGVGPPVCPGGRTRSRTPGCYPVTPLFESGWLPLAEFFLGPLAGRQPSRRGRGGGLRPGWAGGSGPASTPGRALGPFTPPDGPRGGHWLRCPRCCGRAGPRSPAGFAPVHV